MKETNKGKIYISTRIKNFIEEKKIPCEFYVDGELAHQIIEIFKKYFGNEFQITERIRNVEYKAIDVLITKDEIIVIPKFNTECKGIQERVHINLIKFCEKGRSSIKDLYIRLVFMALQEMKRVIEERKGNSLFLETILEI